MLVPELRIRGVPSNFFFPLVLAACRSTKETLERTCSLARSTWCDNVEICSQKMSLEMIYLSDLIMILSVFSTLNFYYGHCDLVWLTFNSIVMFGEMRAFMKQNHASTFCRWRLVGQGCGGRSLSGCNLMCNGHGRLKVNTKQHREHVGS